MLAVHGGSGFFKGRIEKFCSSALKLEKNMVEIPNGSEVEISSQLVRAIMELEQCPHFNCGFGSNLTIEGTVECESAFICSDNFAFGGIAAVTNCIHPIYAAYKLAESNKTNSIENGLIKPMILVGEGANKFCESFTIGIVLNEKLRTEKAKQEKNIAERISINAQNEDSTKISRFDTTGGVYLDANGYCEAGVSSGGILLKKEGRLGHSTQFGAAIWAEKKPTVSVAISLSGCGETLIRTHMAELLAEFFFSCDPNDLFLPEKIKKFLEGEAFIKSNRLKTFPTNYLILGGLAIVQTIEDNITTTTLHAFHNSRHFPIAFKGSDQKIRKYKSKNENVGNFVCNSFVM